LVVDDLHERRCIFDVSPEPFIELEAIALQNYCYL